MHNLDWNNLHFFLEVARSGSLSQAAVRLGVNQSTVSRRIASLEIQLGKKLFERVGNRWLITAIGERLVSASEGMEEHAHSIQRQVLADSHELSGLLRITVAEVTTQSLAMPAIRAFSGKYPEVDMEIIATREELDLAAREADVALRLTDNPPPNLLGRRIATLAYAIYGNGELSEYLNTSTAADLPCITWLGGGHSQAPWVERSFPGTRRIYRTNDMHVMQRMVREGMGVAQMPCPVGDPDPDLCRIPAPYVEPGWGLWVLSHVDLRTTARVRIFRDFLIQELEKQRGLIEGQDATAPKRPGS